MSKAKTPSKKTWRDSLPIDMLLSAVSVLVIAQSISEIPEGLTNNPVYMCVYIYIYIYMTVETEHFDTKRTLLILFTSQVSVISYAVLCKYTSKSELCN